MWKIASCKAISTRLQEASEVREGGAVQEDGGLFGEASESRENGVCLRRNRVAGMTKEESASHEFVNEKELLEKGLELSNQLKGCLPPRIDPATTSIKAKVSFHALCIREVLLYRVSELADTALNSYQKNQLVTSAILARALLESVSLLYWLYKELTRAVEEGSSIRITPFLKRALVGTRNGTTPLEAHNVLNAIDAMGQDVEDWRKLYEELCEIAHPNWGGCLGAYAKFNKEKVWYELGECRLPKPLILGPLVGSIEFFIHYYNDMVPHLKDFAALCEKELESQCAKETKSKQPET